VEAKLRSKCDVWERGFKKKLAKEVHAPTEKPHITMRTLPFPGKLGGSGSERLQMSRALISTVFKIMICAFVTLCLRLPKALILGDYPLEKV